MSSPGKDIPLADCVRLHAIERPDETAFIEPDWQMSWFEYDQASNHLAGIFLSQGLCPGDGLAIYLPDGIGLHIALMAAEKAGLVALGLGAKAGLREVKHLMGVAQCKGLVSLDNYRGEDMSQAFTSFSAVLPALTIPVLLESTYFQEKHSASEVAIAATSHHGTSDVFLLNSTSGTTGMPKCVAHDQARWYAFHREAVSAALLGSSDVFFGAAPPPFGFGLWTSHITPTILGAPTVKLPGFDVSLALRLIESHKVTVLAAVSTQFVMLLNSAEMQSADFSALRVMFTGGERVPYERAVAFEEGTGAAVLQFYGSNETGALSKTSLTDSREKRLSTAGRLLDSMEVRLYDPQGRDCTDTGFGRPAAKGPLLSRGYFGNEEANQQLFSPDGFMFMDDLVRIDQDGYLQVVGRTGDFVIRGGKNISCAAVEEAVQGHPSVALVAAVAAPDEIFGERIMVFVVCHEGLAVSIEELVADLACRQVSRELTPEYLQVRADLPRSSGGKIDKAELRLEASVYVRQFCHRE